MAGTLGRMGLEFGACSGLGSLTPGRACRSRIYIGFIEGLYRDYIGTI